MGKKESAFLELTEDMQHAVREQVGRPVRLLDPTTQEAFVLLRAEEFDRLTDYDDSPWTDEERDLFRAEAVETLNWDGMEAYQDDE